MKIFNKGILHNKTRKTEEVLGLYNIRRNSKKIYNGNIEIINENI